MVSRLGLALGAGASRLILLEKISQHRGSLDAIFQAYLFDAHTATSRVGAQLRFPTGVGVRLCLRPSLCHRSFSFCFLSELSKLTQQLLRLGHHFGNLCALTQCLFRVGSVLQCIPVSFRCTSAVGAATHATPFSSGHCRSAAFRTPACSGTAAGTDQHRPSVPLVSACHGSFVFVV
jgi:hypothetical protein